MMAAAADRRDMRVIIAETRNVLDRFEEKLNEFSSALDELEAEARRQAVRKGWL
jgi:hypothetical protein